MFPSIPPEAIQFLTVEYTYSRNIYHRRCIYNYTGRGARLTRFPEVRILFANFFFSVVRREDRVFSRGIRRARNVACSWNGAPTATVGGGTPRSPRWWSSPVTSGGPMLPGVRACRGSPRGAPTCLPTCRRGPYRDSSPVTPPPTWAAPTTDNSAPKGIAPRKTSRDKVYPPGEEFLSGIAVGARVALFSVFFTPLNDFYGTPVGLRDSFDR